MPPYAIVRAEEGGACLEEIVCHLRAAEDEVTGRLCLLGVGSRGQPSGNDCSRVEGAEDIAESRGNRNGCPQVIALIALHEPSFLRAL